MLFSIIGFGLDTGQAVQCTVRQSENKRTRVTSTLNSSVGPTVKTNHLMFPPEFDFFFFYLEKCYMLHSIHFTCQIFLLVIFMYRYNFTLSSHGSKKLYFNYSVIIIFFISSFYLMIDFFS